MEGEYKTSSNDGFPIDITESGKKIDKRKTNSNKISCREDSPFHKRKKICVDFPSMNSKVYKSIKKFEVTDFELNATIRKCIKPCSVKLIPLDPTVCANYNAHRTLISSPKFLQIHKKEFIDFNNYEQNYCLTASVKKWVKRNSSVTADLIKTLKPCSVLLEKLDLNDISKHYKIHFPMPYSSTGWAELKSCNIKLHRLNIKEEKVPLSHAMDVTKRHIVASKKIATEVLSAFINCGDEKLDDINITSSKDTFKDIELSPLSNCDEVYPNTMATANTFTQLESINSRDTSQNSFEGFSFRSSSIESNLSELCDTHPSDFDCLKNRKTTKLEKTSEFLKEKYLKYDSNDIYLGGKVQIDVPPFNPLCDSENFSRSSEISNEDTVSNLIGNDLKSNESSSLKLAVKSYIKPDKINGAQCQENNMHCCVRCSKALPSLKSLYYHLCQEKQKRGYPCKFCEKNCDFYHALQKHKKSHALRNSLSCSDTMKKRQSNKITVRANSGLEIKKKSNVERVASSNRVDKDLKSLVGKENTSSPKLKSKKRKTKFFLRNISDATTSSGCYSSVSNFLQHIWNPDDSEID